MVKLRFWKKDPIIFKQFYLGIVEFRKLYFFRIRKEMKLVITDKGFIMKEIQENEERKLERIEKYDNLEDNELIKIK